MAYKKYRAEKYQYKEWIISELQEEIARIQKMIQDKLGPRRTHHPGNGVVHDVYVWAWGFPLAWGHLDCEVGALDWSSVSNWIDKAVRLNVHELDIGINKLQLPLSVFTSTTLTKLRISRKSCHYMGWKCPSFVNLPCLKTLDIAGHRSSIVNVFKLIDGCPVLESLSLEVTRHTNKKDYIFNIPTLKRLKLTYRSCTNNVINKVVLRVPNLEYLLVSGVLCSYFVMEDVSSLSKFPFTTSLPIFPNMKHLELKGYLQARLIPQFLRRCPKLKSLCIDAVSKKHEEGCWIKPKLVPTCMLTNLTTIKFSNCNGQKSEVEFLEYMLGNAMVLKTATITCNCLSIEEEKRLCAVLSWFSRASSLCKIHFQTSKLSSSTVYS
ncbi:FBD-associated F-box protein At4g10400 [Helianthus annuus]|uniref:FBD-associated F-box protein At4g10400 n=1 Tax=Helianthus annuus TaxID=4232 RepID=UPI001652C69B|nr:FBD-associated F-box protein At4g10400 [Helianthus annuus]